MTIPEVDALLYIAAAIALIYWLAKAAVGWAGAAGWLSDDVTHGIVNFIP